MDWITFQTRDWNAVAFTSRGRLRARCSTSRRKASVVKRIVHCLPISQKLLHPSEAASFHVLARRNPENPLESPLEMIMAKANFTTKYSKSKFVRKIGFDVFANMAYQFVFRRRSYFSRVTTMTRPETRLFGFIRTRIECHMFLSWTSGWTRRSTIDPRRANREDERSVEPVVSR